MEIADHGATRVANIDDYVKRTTDVRYAGDPPEGTRRRAAFLVGRTANGEMERNASIDGRERRGRTRINVL